MKPNINWINDWQVGVNSSRETAIAKDLLNFFQDLWDKMKLDEKSKTTRNRYANSMHALGGYLVEQAISDDDLGKTADDSISEYIGPDDGPLIFHDNESWQDGIDMVCRKIYKLLRCSDGSMYCGVTNNLEKRLADHNGGNGAKYTRSRLPVELVCSSPEMTKSEAFRLEYRVKRSPTGTKKDLVGLGK